MKCFFYILVGLGGVIIIATRIVWRRSIYARILSPYLSENGCELVCISIPRFYETGPFPKVAVDIGAREAKVLGISLTHVEYRIVTFKDRNGNECTRWVRMLISLGGAQKIIWESGTTEVSDRKR